MRVLYVTSECFPWVKTGGLGDVSAALPPALVEAGVDVRLLLPGYRPVLDALEALEPPREVGPLFGHPGGAGGRLLFGRLPVAGGGAGARSGGGNGSGGRSAPLLAYVLDAPALYRRSGNPYLGPDGRDWPDNPERFAVLGWLAAYLSDPGDGDPGDGIGGPWRPDLVHGHDWQSGLMPAYVAHSSASGRRPATLLTIHNISYQGWSPPEWLARLQLPDASYRVDGVEYYDGIGFLKAGLFYADHITTVSPTYAREIQTAEHGAGLQGLLTSRRAHLTGILNGVDYSVWDPAGDPALHVRYDSASLGAKAADKAALQAELGLAVRPDAPLFGLVSRLTWHKGVDQVLAALPLLRARGAQLAILGTGDPGLETALKTVSAADPMAVRAVIGFDDPLAHRIIAGSDALLVPSRAEPCGLTQLYGLRYGALPVVGRTGGLADTVIDANPAAVADDCATGFVFTPGSAADFAATLERTIEAYHQPALWHRLQVRAMTRDFSWQASARRYRALYERVLAHRR